MRIYMAPFDNSESSDWRSQVSDPTSPSYDLSSEYSRLTSSQAHIIQQIPIMKKDQLKNELQDLLLNIIASMSVLGDQISTLIHKLDMFGSKIDRISQLVSSDKVNIIELNENSKESIIDLLILEINNYLRLQLGEKIEEGKIRINIAELTDEEIVFKLDYEVNSVDNETLFSVIEILNEFGFLIEKDVIIE